jgi:trehalose 6-phosphate phosphatase
VNHLALTSATTLSPRSDWALFLDVDGTLLHIAETPGGVARSEAVCRLLSRLLPRLESALALVSGRTIENLDHLFAPLRLPAAGLHGLERRDAKGRLHMLGEAEALDHLRAPLAELAASHEGLLLEDKGRALALHYRLAPEQGDPARKRIETLVALAPDLRLILGKMVFEIKPRHADKGSAIRTFMAEPPFRNRIPVFIGDDMTDEDGFGAVNALNGLSLHVGQVEATTARYRLADVDQVWQWLANVADTLDAESEGRTP